MVDKINPTSQFHPYSASDAEPHSERPASGGLRGMLGRAGVDSSSLGTIGDKLKGVDVRGSLNKARGMARSNPGLALGGLAIAAIGAGLMRRRF